MAGGQQDRRIGPLGSGTTCRNKARYGHNDSIVGVAAGEGTAVSMLDCPIGLSKSFQDFVKFTSKIYQMILIVSEVTQPDTHPLIL
jgi:hypothetical protein